MTDAAQLGEFPDRHNQSISFGARRRAFFLGGLLLLDRLLLLYFRSFFTHSESIHCVRVATGNPGNPNFEK